MRQTWSVLGAGGGVIHVGIMKWRVLVWAPSNVEDVDKDDDRLSRGKELVVLLRQLLLP